MNKIVITSVNLVKISAFIKLKVLNKVAVLPVF